MLLLLLLHSAFMHSLLTSQTCVVHAVVPRDAKRERERERESVQ